MRTVTFTVYGVAATKGAVKPVPIWKTGADGQKRIVGSRLTEDSKRSRPWQAIVADAARQALGDVAIPFPLDTPVAVNIVFWMPAPKSIPKRRPSAPVGQRCDLDKLERAALDAMTFIVWGDDGQVLYSRKWKAYVAPGMMPHTDITVAAVTLEQWPWNLSHGNAPPRATAADMPSLFDDALQEQL